MSKQIEVIFSANTKAFKDALRRMHEGLILLLLAISIKKLLESIKNFEDECGKIVEKPKEGKQ